MSPCVRASLIHSFITNINHIQWLAPFGRSPHSVAPASECEARASFQSIILQTLARASHSLAGVLSQHLHYIFTTSSLHLHYIFTPSSLHLHSIFTPSSLHLRHIQSHLRHIQSHLRHIQSHLRHIFATSSPHPLPLHGKNEHK